MEKKNVTQKSFYATVLVLVVLPREGGKAGGLGGQKLSLLIFLFLF